MEKAVLVCVVVSMLMGPLNASEGRRKATVRGVESDEMGYREISTLELNQLIYTARSSFVIVDARLAKEDDGRRIADAKFIPVATDAKIIRAMIPNLNTKVIVYSAHGDCLNSVKMAVCLVEMGYKVVFQYAEGIEGWEKSGNKIERVKKVSIRPLPIKPLQMD